MTRAMWMILAAIVFAAGAFGQTNRDPVSFEVASVKRAAPFDANVLRSQVDSPGQIRYGHVQLKFLVMRAFNVRFDQISGPSWLDQEYYDVIAKIPSECQKAQVPLMLQKLLADRFRMEVHRETKEKPVYELVVAKGGPKLEPTAEKTSGDGLAPDGPPRSFRLRFSSAGPVDVRDTTLAAFANLLSRFLDRPVIDKTGIVGSFDIQLEISKEDSPLMRRMASLAAGDAGTSIEPQESTPSGSTFSSIRSLGLELRSARGRVEYIVIDRVDKIPTEN